MTRNYATIGAMNQPHTMTAKREKHSHKTISLENYAIRPAKLDGYFSAAIGAGLPIAVVFYILAGSTVYIEGWQSANTAVLWCIVGSLWLGLAWGGHCARGMLAIQIAEFDRFLATVERTEERTEPTIAPIITMNKQPIRITSGAGTAVFHEPDGAHASFRQWARDVTAENSRKQFSANEARRRGWPDDTYEEMVGELRRIGVFANEQFNSSLKLTVAGKAALIGWLER